MGSFPFRKCSAALLVNPGKAQGADANFYYYSGTSIDGSMLLITRKGKTLLTSQMNLMEARKQAKCRAIAFGKGVLSKLVGRAKTIGIDFKTVNLKLYSKLKKSLPGKKFVDISGELENFRAVKTNDEISKIRKAARISADILESVRVGSGMSEIGLAGILAKKALDMGYTLAYPTIVASGANSAFPHHTPSNKKLSGIVLVDFGVKYKGYCADLTRCFFIGGCGKEKKKYQEAQEVFFEIVDALPDCRTGGDLSKLAEKVARKKGWPKLLHAIGHGIGLEVHERPFINEGSGDRIRDGTVIALEPAWYGGKFGTRFENDVVITSNKAKILL